MVLGMRAARKRLGLTQKEVAQKLNIGQQWYSKYECGEHEPSVSAALRIADALDVTTLEEFRRLFMVEPD